MEIHVLNCGYIRISDRLIETGGMMSDLRRAVLAPDQRRVELPVSAFLIEHKSGLFLVDTGLSRDISPAGVYDKRASEKVLSKHLTAVYHPYVPAGMAVPPENRRFLLYRNRIADYKVCLQVFMCSVSAFYNVFVYSW